MSATARPGLSEPPRVEYMFCDACQMAARHMPLLSADGGASWQWADTMLWKQRDEAHRVFQVLAKAEQELTADRTIARERTNALVRRVFGRDDVGPWWRWSADDCTALFRASDRLLMHYADQLVTDRVTVAALHAKQSRFPRLVFAVRMMREAVRRRWRRWWDGSPKMSRAADDDA